MMHTLSPLVTRFPTSPVPSISIDFAPVEEMVPEPPSPFASSRGGDDDESLRSTHLLPPPAISPRARHMHHMQQQAAQQQHQQQQQQQRQRQQGVDPARFESMLQFARSERSAIAPNASNQQLELRKEVAFKAHQSRQADRRRLFLSKIVALPSPTATATPVTPPESPAVFHFTLPSPGLVSPLALFETLDYDPTSVDVRIEHVDFRARAKRDADAMAAITRNVKQSMEINGLSSGFPLHGRKQRQPLSPALPSLAQISARLSATNNVTTNRAPAINGASRLPAFLRKTDAAPDSPPSPAVVTPPAATSASRLPAFLRSREQKRSPTSSSGSSDTIRPALRSPRSPAPPALSITPPDAPLPSPTPSIAIFAPTSPPGISHPSDDAAMLDRRARHAKDMVDKLRRRVSAPAELTSRKDSHPILKVHGGF